MYMYGLQANEIVTRIRDRDLNNSLFVIWQNCYFIKYLQSFIFKVKSARRKNEQRCHMKNQPVPNPSSSALIAAWVNLFFPALSVSSKKSRFINTFNSKWQIFLRENLIQLATTKNTHIHAHISRISKRIKTHTHTLYKFSSSIFSKALFISFGKRAWGEIYGFLEFQRFFFSSVPPNSTKFIIMDGNLKTGKNAMNIF